MPESQLMVLEVSFVDMDQPMPDLQAIQITASKQTHKRFSTFSGVLRAAHTTVNLNKNMLPTMIRGRGMPCHEIFAVFQYRDTIVTLKAMGDHV